jgi:hypothetical protein
MSGSTDRLREEFEGCFGRLAAIEEVTPRGSVAGARYNPEMMANVNA